MSYQTTVIKYNNELNNISFGNFTENDMNVFFAILAKIKESGEKETLLNFNELKNLAKIETKDNKQFIQILDRTYKKILEMTIPFEDENEIMRFVLFTKYKIDKKTKNITIKINEEFEYILNNLQNNFTRFELIEFVSIDSKFIKTIYRICKQFRTTGFVKISFLEFKRLLNIQDSYKQSDINKRILNPAKEELSKYFIDFDFKKEANGIGTKEITDIVFSFKPEKNRKLITLQEFILLVKNEYANKVIFTTEDGRHIACSVYGRLYDIQTTSDLSGMEAMEIWNKALKMWIEKNK